MDKSSSVGAEEAEEKDDDDDDATRQTAAEAAAAAAAAYPPRTLCPRPRDLPRFVLLGLIGMFINQVRRKKVERIRGDVSLWDLVCKDYAGRVSA